MLLPSAIAFDLDDRVPSSNGYFHTSLGSLVSPPISPPSHTSHSSAISSIFSTCRALQSMLTTPNQLPPTPLASPLQLRSPAPSSAPNSRLKSARFRKMSSEGDSSPIMRVAKRSMPIRGNKKRSRDDNDDGTKDTVLNRSYATTQVPVDNLSSEGDSILPDRPSTPKRSRIAPETIPFGLARSDYHDLHLKSMYESSNTGSSPSYSSTQSKSVFSTPPPAFSLTIPRSSPPSYSPTSNRSSLVLRSRSSTAPSSSPSPFNSFSANAMSEVNSSTAKKNTAGKDDWAIEDDKMLIELVLEKLKLSKSELEECARSLGRDSGSVSKRWKNLMATGSIGLKGGSIGRKTVPGRKRSKIPDTWR